MGKDTNEKKRRKGGGDGEGCGEVGERGGGEKGWEGEKGEC